MPCYVVKQVDRHFLRGKLRCISKVLKTESNSIVEHVFESHRCRYKPFFFFAPFVSILLLFAQLGMPFQCGCGVILSHSGVEVEVEVERRELEPTAGGKAWTLLLSLFPFMNSISITC